MAYKRVACRGLPPVEVLSAGSFPWSIEKEQVDIASAEALLEALPKKENGKNIKAAVCTFRCELDGSSKSEGLLSCLKAIDEWLTKKKNGPAFVGVSILEKFDGVTAAIATIEKNRTSAAITGSASSQGGDHFALPLARDTVLETKSFECVEAPLMKAIKDFKDAMVSADHTFRAAAIGTMRGKDTAYVGLSQGCILMEHILEERQSICLLAAEAKNCDVIFSIKRGGTLLADKIAANLGLISPPMVSISKEPPGSKTQSHIPDEFESAITGYVNRRITEGEKQQHLSEITITIGIAESFIGGGAANKMLEFLEAFTPKLIKSAREGLITKPGGSSKSCSIAFKLLLTHQTLQASDAPLKEIYDTHRLLKKLPSELSANIEVVIADTPYISGEDVNYQCQELPDKTQGKPPKEKDETPTGKKGKAQGKAQGMPSERESILRDAWQPIVVVGDEGVHVLTPNEGNGTAREILLGFHKGEVSDRTKPFAQGGGRSEG